MAVQAAEERKKGNIMETNVAAKAEDSYTSLSSSSRNSSNLSLSSSRILCSNSHSSRAGGAQHSSTRALRHTIYIGFIREYVIGMEDEAFLFGMQGNCYTCF